MDDSILNSIKVLIGIDPSYDCFDQALIIHINLAFSILAQLGVGPDKGFRIEDADAVWDDYETNENIVGLVKDYMQLKVKLLFDPPSSSAVMEAVKEMTKEFEFRLQVAVESIKANSGEEIQNG